ncbi:S41 family peptidase [[Empedobacter] haloabium]|uniref:S41 family peptidase n=1 Tax=[Empedobacter] haloabium TaxID=592317 RepID=A0ABZ1UFD1_9BURK
MRARRQARAPAGRLRALAAMAGLALSCAGGPVAAAPTDEELLGIARLWRDVGSLHPALAGGEVAWDAALADAMPALLDASTPAQLEQGVRRLMAPLHDPGVRLWTRRDVSFVPWPAAAPLIEWLAPDTALLHLHAGRAPDPARWRAALDQLGPARRVVVDLRAVAWDMGETADALSAMAARVVDGPLVLPAEQYRFAAGTRPLAGTGGGAALHGGLLTLESSRLVPVAGAARRALAFLVDDVAAVPAVALALQRRGQAVLLAPAGSRSRCGPSRLLRVGALRVEFSAGSLVDSAGLVPCKVDGTVPAATESGIGSAAVRAAYRTLSRPSRRVAAAQPGGLPLAVVRQGRDGPRLPPPQWRQAAAIELWAALDMAHPARRLFPGDWDEALLRCLKGMAAADTELAYGLALQRMAAAAGDSHVRVFSRALDTARGRAQPGVRLAQVEGRIAVTGFADDPAAAAGLLAGDELLAIDGVGVRQRLDELLPQVSASTAAGGLRTALEWLTAGPEGSVALLRVAREGAVREFALPRRRIDDERPQRPAGDAVRILPGNVGYVDLDRLERSEVASMFDTIGTTRAVIFDLRGYPRQTAWSIAPRLAHGAAGALRLYETFVTGVAGGGRMRLERSQGVDNWPGPRYNGKVVVLIDERTMSQAEHTALLLEAASAVTFVGSPTVGADGDLRHVVLPGKVTVSFSGLEVVHADGRQLQRVGLQPHVPASPTFVGLRAGRDEVLARALRVLDGE